MGKINKRELSKTVSERSGISAAAARDLVGHVFAAITEELCKGNSLTIAGFGTWRMNTCPPRVGRNVNNGEVIAIPPRTRVAFKAGAALRREAESSIEPEIYFGAGVAASTELKAVFERLFGSETPDLASAEVRARIHAAASTEADREAIEFFESLMRRQIKEGDSVDEPAKSDEPVKS